MTVQDMTLTAATPWAMGAFVERRDQAGSTSTNLKTVEPKGSRGSNPFSSAIIRRRHPDGVQRKNATPAPRKTRCLVFVTEPSAGPRVGST
jgi:hypothetical protein